MQRLVLKVGSAVLTQSGVLALDRMQSLVEYLVELKKENEVIIVSSGAVSAGYTKLKLDRSILHNKQALASLGQPMLMREYTKKFEKQDLLCAQVLVTAANLNKIDDVQRIKNTVEVLLGNGIIPIVNENDATATDELEVGDNDQLSGYITAHINADLLIILSDIDAYYDMDPRKHKNAKVLMRVLENDSVQLGDLLKDPRNRTKPLDLVALVVQSDEGKVIILPGSDYLVKAGDQLLLCGTDLGYRLFLATVNNEYKLYHVRTGLRQPRSFFMQWYVRKMGREGL